MSKKRILHVSVRNATAQELEQIRDKLEGDFPGREIIVTDDGVDVFESPALDEFVDEIVDRMSDEMEKPKFGERL